MNVSKRKVPHEGPIGAEIFLLAEAPGEDEDIIGRPLVGRSGEFLNKILTTAGIEREACRVGNVLNYKPNLNEFSFAHGSWQLDESLKELYAYLNESPPKIVIAMGNEALRALMGFEGISKFRGSVLRRDSYFVIPTYHPAAALRAGDLAPQIVFDLQRAQKVLREGYTLPPHNFVIDPPEVKSYTPALQAAPFVTCDIETIEGTRHILCVGFGWSDQDALVIRNRHTLGNGCEPEFRAKVQLILDSLPDFTLHNGTFDFEQLQLNGFEFDPVQKHDYDTMFAQRVIEPELPIGLDFCTSIYTNEPYYKDDRKTSGKKVSNQLEEYNAKDCICTWQTRRAQEQIFAANPNLYHTYLSDMQDLPVIYELQRTGMPEDRERRLLLKQIVEAKKLEAEQMLYILAGKQLNIRSSDQVKKLLYNDLKLPKRTNYKTKRLTSNEDAIVSLIQYTQREMEQRKTEEAKNEWLRKLGVLKMLLEVRGHNKLIDSYLGIEPSSDGRYHSSYGLAGTETGRWSCGTYVDGSGLAAQGMPRELLEVEDS